MFNPGISLKVRGEGSKIRLPQRNLGGGVNSGRCDGTFMQDYGVNIWIGG